MFSSRPRREGAACLPRDDPAPAARAAAVAAQRREYCCEQLYPGLPPLMRRQPACERCLESTLLDAEFWVDVLDIVGDMALQWTLHAFRAKRDAFDFYRRHIGHATRVGLGMPGCAQPSHNAWMTDAEFGWQKMNGVCPFVLRRVDGALPAGFAVTDAHLRGVLPAGVTLAQLAAQRRLFVSSYSEMEEPWVDPAACAASGWCLCWSDADRALMPIAIQLANRADGSPVFTPRDGNNWLAAKMHCQSAEHSWDIIHHIFATHFVGEAVYCALQRHVHRSHPLHVLLSEHFFHTIGVNAIVKAHAMVPGDPSAAYFTLGSCREKFMAKANETWSFASLDAPADIRARGLDDAATLPGHLWRDDALALWAAIRAFAGGVVGAFYACDEDVAGDAELAAWVAEMTADCSAGGCGFRGLPVGDDGRMATVEQLALFVTMLINNQTVNHSVSGNAVFHLTTFVPNMPGQFHLPVARLRELHAKAEDVEISEIVAALPSLFAVTAGISGSYRHAQRKHTPLGTYGSSFFREERVAALRGAFTAELWGIETAMRRRNAVLDAANPGGVRGGARGYEYLLPSMIGASVSL
jgi:hypothetical protein